MEDQSNPQSTMVNGPATSDRATTENASKSATHYAALALMSLSSLLYYALAGDQENAGLTA